MKALETFYEWIGENAGGPTPLQMALRALLVFIVALALIRFSGRRVFGLRSPFDNVVSILLGAILSRSVIGGVPFFSPIVASAAIVCLHRFCAWISFYSDRFGVVIKGNPLPIYKDGAPVPENLRAAFISKKDFAEGLRKENLDSPEKIKSAYVERDGSISVVKE